MKSYRSIIYLILFAVVLLLAKYLFFPGNQEGQDKMGPGGGKGMQKSNVEGFIVKPSVMNNRLFVTGSILANEMVELRTEIAGKIASLPLHEGQPVQKGQLLVKLVDDDLKAQLRKVQSELKLAADKQLRLKELYNSQGVSKEEYDAADNGVKSLEADAEVLKVQINRTEVRAPFDGIVGLKNISEGSYVTQQQVIAVIQQLNPLKIDFSVPERYATLIKQNIEIDFTVEGSENKYKGTVYAINPGIDPVTRTLKVRARASNPGNQIIPGSFAKIEILLKKIDDALMIPSLAIVPVLKGQQVFVSRGGIAEVVPVKLGIRDEKTIQVLDGLNIGDTVITTGVMGVRPGAALKFLSVQ
jgi:membrane fusion protein, multidrug efflux system